MAAPNPFAWPVFASFFVGSSLSAGADGSFDFLPPAYRVVHGSSPPPPSYTPALKFNDRRNSMYL